jgi:hypothetical protein
MSLYREMRCEALLFWALAVYRGRDQFACEDYDQFPALRARNEIKKNLRRDFARLVKKTRDPPGLFLSIARQSQSTIVVVRSPTPYTFVTVAPSRLGERRFVTSRKAQRRQVRNGALGIQGCVLGSKLF